MRKTSHYVLLVLALSGCGEDRRLGGEPGTGGANLGGANLGGASGGPTTHATGGTLPIPTATGGTSTSGGAITAGGASQGGATQGGALATSSGGATGRAGGAPSGGTVNSGVGGSVTGGTSSGGRASGGSATSGMTHVGSSGGGTGGALVGGGGNAGASAGGAGDCIPVCPLYGAPCCLWQTSCLGPTGGCKLDVLAASVGMTYDYTELEAKVAALPQDISATISDQDIAWIAADPWPAARMELHLTEDAAARYGAILDNARDLRVFRVSCDGKPLYVGVFYLIYGAAGISTPVLHEARENGVLVLRLGAAQGAWIGGPVTSCGTKCQRIDRIELRATFCRRGVMHELDPNARPLNP